MVFLKILSQQALALMITDIYQTLVENREVKDEEHTIRAEMLRADLKQILYSYLTRFTINSDLALIAAQILTEQDLMTLKRIETYNYNKIKITRDDLRKSNNHPSGGAVQEVQPAQN
jgi:hypothetical protein